MSTDERRDRVCAPYGGEMTISITLSDANDGGTDLVAVHDDVPPGVSAAANEAGWQSALARLAALVEAG
jgi:hypothetical protein